MQTDGVLTSLSVAQASMARLKARRENPSELSGYSWGLPTLDYLTGGIQAGLTVLGAETGAGKSLLGGQIALTVAGQLKELMAGKVCRIVHCEMTPAQFQDRLVAQLSGVSERQMRTGKVSDAEYKRIYDAQKRLGALQFEYLEDPKGVEETIEFISRGGNCGWFLVDHAQAHNTDRQGMSPLDFRALGELANALGKIANRIPGMLLSQLVNDVGKREDHRPHKDDLFGGKALQQPASLILLLYRPDVYLEPSEDKAFEPKTAHLYIGKNRWTSDVGDCKMLWVPKEGIFVDAGFKAATPGKAA